MVTGNRSEDDCRAMLERDGRSRTRADASNLRVPMYDLTKPFPSGESPCLVARSICC